MVAQSFRAFWGFWAVICYILIVGVLPALLIYKSRPKNQLEKFESDGILADLKIKMPTSLLKVMYGAVDVTPGMALTPSQVRTQPIVKWKANENAFYTIEMIDPDAPSRANPTSREIHHWGVVNIPGSNVDAGEIVASYRGSGPPQGSGLHRYIFLVFKQPSGRTDFPETRVNVTSRARYSVSAFAALHSLGDPVAGNYFQAEFEG